MMNIKIWGCRGSLPAPGTDKDIYGGNTSCIEIIDGDTCIILDGGSGLQRLNNYLAPNITRIDILLTHLHLDHIMGLGFFWPLYNPNMTVNIWGPAASNESLAQRLRRYFSPPIFPVRLNELPCKGELFEIDSSEFQIGNFKITSEYVCHPGPTVAYRLQTGNTVIAYIPDHEPALGSSQFPTNAEWTSGFSIAEGADILFHDAQYSSEEYKTRIGWGHSSVEDALDFGTLAKVKKIVLFHHDPAHTDDNLKTMLAETLQEKKCDFEVEIATEGTLFEFES
nr:MBL fold metallo-hydrolase [Bacteroidota bacterium]